MKNIQRDNSDVQFKINIRAWVIENSKRPRNILDLYAGDGSMYEKIWKQYATKYTAIDKKKIHRPNWIQGDNRKLIPDLVNEFNIYDCDAYDNPWIIASNICRLRKPGKFFIITTCGISRGLKNGKSSGFIRYITGLNQLSDSRLSCRWYDDIIRIIMTTWEKKYHCKILQCKRAFSRFNQNKSECYYAISLEKQA